MKELIREVEYSDELRTTRVNYQRSDWGCNTYDVYKGGMMFTSFLDLESAKNFAKYLLHKDTLDWQFSGTWDKGWIAKDVYGNSFQINKTLQKNSELRVYFAGELVGYRNNVINIEAAEKLCYLETLLLSKNRWIKYEYKTQKVDDYSLTEWRKGAWCYEV
jgi:hypothetical protein